MYDGYRRFLQEGSRGRQRVVHYAGEMYEYRDRETRPTPKMRDDSFVRACVTAAQRLRQPIVGHKHVPLLANWPGYNWYRLNTTTDWMHGE